MKNKKPHRHDFIGPQKLKMGFSLVEMLMALLVASLLLAALAPVMTKRMADNINITGISAKSDSNTVVTVFNEDGTFEVPDGVLNLKVTMIGGGGAGGSAFYGSEEFTNSRYWTVPENVTKLRVFMIGGGGGGASGNLSSVTAYGSFSTPNETSPSDFTEGETAYTLPDGAKIPALDAGCKNAGLTKWKLAADTSKEYTPGHYYTKITACGGGGGGTYYCTPGIIINGGGGGGTGGYVEKQTVTFDTSKVWVKVGGGGGSGAHSSWKNGGYAAGGGGGSRYDNVQNPQGNGGTYGGAGGSHSNSAEAGSAGSGAKGEGTAKANGGIGGSITNSSSTTSMLAGNGGAGGIWGGGGGGGGRNGNYYHGGGGGGGGGPTTISSTSGTSGKIYFQVGGGGGGGDSCCTSAEVSSGGGGGGGGYAGGGGGGGGGQYLRGTAGNGGTAGIGDSSILGSISRGQNGINATAVCQGGGGGGGFGGASGTYVTGGNYTPNGPVGGKINTIFGESFCDGGDSTRNTSAAKGRAGKLRMYYGGTNIFKCTYNPVPNGGGGGGAGQITITEINVTPGQKLYFEIGDGGSAQNERGKAGNAGKASNIRIDNVSGSILATAKGGNPGQHSTVAATASAGGAKQDLNFIKNWTGLSGFIAYGGSNSTLTTASSNKGYGGAGGMSYDKSGNRLNGGAGGNSSKNGSMPATTSYGAGGGGGSGATSVSDTTFGTGAAGAGGYIYIEYGGSSGSGGTAGEFLTKTITPPSSSVDIVVGKGGDVDTGDGSGGTSKFGNHSAQGGLKGNDGGMDRTAHGAIKRVSEYFVNKNFSETAGQAGNENYGGMGGYMRYIYQADGGTPVTSITSKDGTIIGPVISGCGGKMTFSMSSSLYGVTCNESGKSAAAQDGKDGTLGGGGGGGTVYNNAGGKGGRGGDGAVVVEYRLIPVEKEE